MSEEECAKRLYEAYKASGNRLRNVSIEERSDGAAEMTIGMGGHEEVWYISSKGEFKKVPLLKGNLRTQ